MANINNQKLYVTKQELEELYISKNLTQTQIAQHYGVCVATIHYHLNKHAIKKDINNISGYKYNKLLVIEKIGTGRRGVIWKCKCECGGYKNIASSDLKSGQVKSCGCLIYNTGNKHSGFKGKNDLYGIFISNIRQNAKSRNLKFNLTCNYLWNLFVKQNKKCAISNLDLFFAKKAKHTPEECNASIDRINPAKGYIKGNVQWVHKQINIMKSTMSMIEFIKICELVYKQNIDLCENNELTIDNIKTIYHNRRLR